MNLFVRSLCGQYIGRSVLLNAETGGGGGAAGDGGQGSGSGQGEPGGGQSGQGTGDPTNSLDELMKDPAFKAAYEAKLQSHLSSRLKKFDGVDPEEYKRLKQAEEEKANAELSEADKLNKKIAALEAERTTLEAKEREIAIKEYAFAEGLDPKLISRLADKNAIKKGESGQFEGIAEAVEQIKTEFPQLFQAAPSGSGDNKPPSHRVPGQNGNPPTHTDPKEAGKALAMRRHGKAE